MAGLSSIGWTTDDLVLFDEWFFDDSGVYDREHLDELVDREVGDVEEVPHAAAPTPASSDAAIMPTASSISASPTVIGGASRSAVAVTAFCLEGILAKPRPEDWLAALHAPPVAAGFAWQGDAAGALTRALGAPLSAMI